MTTIPNSGQSGPSTSSFRSLSERFEIFKRDGLLKLIVTIVMTTAGVITAYHATVYGIKAELATKADAAAIVAIDERLTRIEAILTERVATKDELRLVRDDLTRELLIIQAKLNLLP